MNRIFSFLLGIGVALIASSMMRSRGLTETETFITRTGTITDPKTHWQVIVDEHSGRHSLIQGDSLIAPMWAMKPGWFVYVENQHRVWSFNGADQLLLFVAGDGPDTGAFGPDNAPFAVPQPVVRRVGEHHIHQLATAARTSRERLGIAPNR